MGSSVNQIPLVNLVLAFVPVLVVVVILYKWSSNYRSAVWNIYGMLSVLD
jgi:uncharacterized membrane protein